MPRPLRSRAHGVAVACLLLVLLATLSCTETDEALVDQVGVTRLFLIDSGILRQSVVTPFERIQVVEWKIAEAVLDIDDSLVEIVAAGDGCWVTDTIDIAPVSEGPCATGIVIEAPPAPQDVQLILTIESMQVRRGEPLDLSLSEDYDGDGVPDDGDGSGSAFDAPCGFGDATVACDDNCPLVSNPDQADSNGDGVGNACSVFDVFAGVLLDSDGDAVADATDNCVWIFNPDQADSTGRLGMPIDDPEAPPKTSFSDGIGDACAEQLAPVTVRGSMAFGLILGPTTLVQGVETTTFITVDFDNADALSCRWDALSCELDPSKVRLCTHPNFFAALGGC